MDKLLLPVTDWEALAKRKEQGEEITLWRDGKEYKFMEIDDHGNILTRVDIDGITSNFPRFFKETTFLMEVKPVVRFQGHSYYVPYEETDMEITCSQSAGYSFYDRSCMGKIVVPGNYEVIVLKGGQND